MIKIYITLLLLSSIFLSVVLNGQTTQQAKTFEIDVPISWEASYKAKEKITLKPGFSFTAESSKSFTGTIDPTLTNTNDGGIGDIAPDVPSGFANSGGNDAPPGALPMNANITGTGAATAYLPFEFPQGVGSIMPNLSMSYNSQGGNGAFGFGSNLSGIPMITRIAKSHYYDNEVQGLTLEEEDQLMLDGSRLILETGTYGETGATYSLESDNFSKITTGVATFFDAPSTFTVENKDGTIITFGGLTSAAKIRIGTASKHYTYAWLISEAVDRRGNYVKYNYAPNSNGQMQISSIEYTGNEATGLAPQYTITFDYNNFTESESNYIGGQKLQYDLHITDIVVTDNLTGTELYKYSFQYADKRLTQISKYYKGSLECSPTQISWNSTNELTDFIQGNEWDDSPIEYGNLVDYISIPGDFNGDRKPDILQINRKMNSELGNNDWHLLSRNEANGELEEINTGFLPPRNKNKTRVEQTVWVGERLFGFMFPLIRIVTVSRTFGNNFPYTVFDIDKDGILELCLIEGNDDVDATDCCFKAYKIIGDVLVEQTEFTETEIGLSAPSEILLAGDFTGKGISDILRLEMGSMGMTEVQTSLTSEESYFLASVELDNQFTQFEMDGDAQIEFMIADQEDIKIYAAENISGVNNFNIVASIVNVKPTETMPADYNADGLTDIMLFNDNIKKWQLYLSNGKDGFVLQNDSFLAEVNDASYTNYGRMEHDPDYDGNYYRDHGNAYPEKAFFSIDPTVKSFDRPEDVNAYYSELDGGHYTIEELDRRYKTTNCNQYISTDVNGDGKTDIVRFERFNWVTYLENDQTFEYFYTKYAISVFIATANGFSKQRYEGPDLWYNLGSSIPHYDPLVESKIGSVPYRFNEEEYIKNSVSATDFNNDGINEIVFTSGQSVSSFDGTSYGDIQNSNTVILQFFGGQSNSLISDITDGMDITTHFDYEILNNSNTYEHNPTVGLPVNTYEYPLPLKVVSKKIVKQSGNIFSNTDYTYNTMRINTKKGFLGFKSYTSNDASTGVSETVEFSINENFLIPYVSSKKTYKNNNPISQIDYEYYFVGRKGKQYFKYLNKRTKIDKLKNVSNILDNTINLTSGNISSQTETFGADGYITTTFPSYNEFGQPFSIIETRNQNGAFITTTSYTYDTYGNIRTKTENNGVTTTFTYCTDRTNVDYIEEDALNTKTTFEYDNSKKFITQKEIEYSDGKKHIETYKLDNEGRKLRITDKNGLITNFQYDEFGKISSKLFPNGNREIHSYDWLSGGINYSEKKTDDTGNEETLYYNTRNQLVLKEEKLAGSKAVLVTTSANYNGDGSINYTESSLDGTTQYTYRNDGRVESITDQNGTTGLSYSGRTVTTTRNGISSSKSYNAFNQITSANDKGGSIVYSYHASGNPASITTNGNTVSITYDALGNQATLNDPNAGEITYIYDNLGRLQEMTDANGNHMVNAYCAIYGRLLTETTNAGSKAAGSTRVRSYYYDPDNEHLGYMSMIGDSESGIATTYTYDRLGNVISIEENIDGSRYKVNYEYDAIGHITRIMYPDGFSVSQAYDGSFIESITNDADGTLLFSAYSYNNRGQVTEYTQGNGNVVNKGYASNGNIESYIFGKANNRIAYNYSYSSLTNLIEERSKTYTNGNIHQEKFTYDDLYRLISWEVSQSGTTTPYTMNYSSNGNIVQKSGMGYYSYSGTKPNAVSTVSQLSGNAVSTKYNDLSYNTFNSIANIDIRNSEGEAVTGTYSLTYGPDNQRRVSEYNGLKTIYFGLYEKRSDGTIIRYIKTPNGLNGAYITGSSVVGDGMYYLHNDHLGSLVAVGYEAGDIIEEFSYDPWGRRRNATDWNDYDITASALFTRGFTGHEHINGLSLINMNGRIYDPRLGRMLQPDNYVQIPDFTQGLNRYSYCINNPLKYTDPTGEKFLGSILTAVGDFLWTAYVKGGFDPTSRNARRNAWKNYDPTAQWSKTNKAWRIDVGQFKTDPNRNFGQRAWQLISRNTWEVPQVMAGKAYSHGRNMTGHVDRIEYFGGATFVIDEDVTNFHGWRGISLGNYIGIQIPGKLNVDHPKGWMYSENGLFWHEYGHTFDSQLFGISYLLAIGIPSIGGADWTETRANKWAWWYAEKYEFMDEWLYPYRFPLK